jgi:hypothetical protein
MYESVWKEACVRILAAIIAFPLAACGMGAQMDARNEYQQATDSYKQCMAANPGAPQQCEALRLAMETAGRKYEEVSPNFLDKMKVRPGNPPPDYADTR